MALSKKAKRLIKRGARVGVAVSKNYGVGWIVKGGWLTRTTSNATTVHQNLREVEREIEYWEEKFSGDAELLHVNQDALIDTQYGVKPFVLAREWVDATPAVREDMVVHVDKILEKGR